MARTSGEKKFLKTSDSGNIGKVGFVDNDVAIRMHIKLHNMLNTFVSDVSRPQYYHENDYLLTVL